MQDPSVNIMDNIIWASGDTGEEMRPDGKGGWLRRGYYVRVSDGVYGPWRAREALLASLLIEIIDAEYDQRMDVPAAADRLAAAIINADGIVGPTWKYLPPGFRS